MRLMFFNNAHAIFNNNYKKKFTLEHAWRELRHDQKWCGNESRNKRKKFDDGSHSAAKARGKKRPMVEKSEYQTMCTIKQEDLAVKERLGKMKLLDSLIAKQEPLADEEAALKKKLILELIDTPTYPENFFQRHFRMNKPLFMHIVDRLSNEVEYFRKRKMVSEGIVSLLYKNTVDEYLRLGETTTRLCVQNFVEGIIYLFGDEYLRRPTPADLQRLLDIREHRGFPGMIGSIDCTLNDINVLDRSHVFDDIIKSQAPQVSFYVNGREYHMAYYLTDGIYPKWATFIQSIPIPQGPKAVLFAQRQEAVRKDVERAFGVLQARFVIVKNPALFWDKVKIGKIMRACIILHNMIVEEE
uniref:No apical meristem-associated C-terminal domain-containing protein n=1 Tax=Brassica oleracea var. oleracea TaxID=109376 RepID=A0A0D3CHK8_BRAOL